MLNFRLTSFLLVLSIISVQSQSLLTTAHNFGNVYETEVDSFSLVFNNDFPFDMEIIEVTDFEKYNYSAFSVSDSNFIIPSFGSANVWVYFHPNQNVFYEQQVVFHSKTRGSTHLEVKGQGVFSKTYYQSTQNKSEQSLKTTLKTITGQGYSTLSYNLARDKMYGSIDNVNGDVECVYTGRTATFNTRAGANSNRFNCEHTWPQSLFSSASPMKSDIHHLFPTDVTANSQRGSLPFGTVSGSGSWNNGGSKKNSTHFEPRDIHKGTVARAMMYFVTRYQNYSSFFTGQETILRQWHKQHPVSIQDINRNDDIYSEQNNRNPFVDYPQFIDRINSLSNTSVEPVVDSLYLSTDTVLFENLVNGDSLIYNYVMVNSGNSTIQVSSITMAINSDYSILNMPTPFSLDPGEAKTIQFYMIQSFSSVHTFTVNSSIGNFIGYVTSGPDVGLDDWIAERIEVYPNPTIDHVRLFAPISELLSYQFVDANGNILDGGTFRGEITIDTRPLRWGIYYLNIYRESLIYTEKILKVSR